MPKKIYKLQKPLQNEKFSKMQNPSHAQWVTECVAQRVGAYTLLKIFLLKQGTLEVRCARAQATAGGVAGQNLAPVT